MVTYSLYFIPVIYVTVGTRSDNSSKKENLDHSFSHGVAHAAQCWYDYVTD